MADNEYDENDVDEDDLIDDLIDDDEVIDDDVIDDLDIEILDSNENSTKSSVHKTSPYMSKYEYTRIISRRAIDISNNYPITINPGREINPIEIARRELYARTLPLTIRRYLPTSEHDDWNVNDLILPRF